MSFRARSSLLSLLCLSLLGCWISAASAQAPKTIGQQIVGTWSLVSVYNIQPDGSKIFPNGANSRGRAIFDAKGNVAVQLINPEIPKLASNNRLQGTAEENKAVAQGVLSWFGTYTVDEAKKTVTFKIEASSFPNQVGTASERAVTISGDDLQWITQGAPAGGVAYNSWKRVK